MNKKLFGELIESIKEAGRIARGEAKPGRVTVYSQDRVKELRDKFRPSQIVRVRKRLKMSQAELANVMMIPKATLQSWEQGRRQPEGPALVLIRVMDRNPKAIVEALHA